MENETQMQVDNEEGLTDRLLPILIQSNGLDLKQYQLPALGHAVRERMETCKATSLDDYLEIVEKDSNEQKALYLTLLIGETGFFRNSAAFKVLAETVVPRLYERNEEGSEIRIWSAGTATGEEAYSIAILLEEYAREQNIKPVPYRIFATDPHKAALQVGLEGYYPAAKVEELSASLRKRYFVKYKSSYRVATAVRNKVVFAQHDLLVNPPFTKMDLVLCRGVLAYFNEAARERAIALLHFSLRLGGFLFADSKDFPEKQMEGYESLDAESCIYVKSTESVSPIVFNPPKEAPERRVVQAPVQPSSFDLDTPLQSLVSGIVEKHMPPGLVIDQDGSILHIFGDCQAFMVALQGKVSLSLDDSLRPELRSPCTLACKSAIEKQKLSSFEKVALESDGAPILVDITAEPLPEVGIFERCVHLQFKRTDLKASEESAEIAVYSSESQIDQLEHHRLKAELNEVKRRLEESLSENAVSSQELHMAYEELLTSNEELQSTNEELHSVNEELFSVNAEYQSKNRELTMLNEDINNLFLSTEIGTIFVDANLRIRKFTPSASKSINLLEADIGRPISHISHRFLDYDRLVEDTQRVIQSGEPFEREARTGPSEWYLMRFLPFKTAKLKNLGAVITLIDISALKIAEQEIEERQRKLRLAIEAAEFGLWTWDIAEGSFELDARCTSILGLDSAEMLSIDSFLNAMNLNLDTLLNHSDISQDEDSGSFQQSWCSTLRSGDLRYLSARGIVYRDENHKVTRASGVLWDETEVKSQEQQVLQKKNDLETLLYVISHDLREPLRAIKGFSSLLFERYTDQLDEKAKSFVKRIDAGADRMASLLDDVLSLSRINRMDTDREKIPGTTLVSLALKGLESKIKETDAKLTIASEFPHLRVNLTFAKQALYNLLGNALKFVEEGKAPEIEISPYLSGDGRYAGFVIRDRGPGIPDDCVERVFKLFQRGVPRNVEGTGAGLAIVKQVAQKHGGDVWYEPRPGGGSKFTLSFLM